jgi:hypothetical protein
MAELNALCADWERCIRVEVRWNLFDATAEHRVQGAGCRVQLVCVALPRRAVPGASSLLLGFANTINSREIDDHPHRHKVDLKDAGPRCPGFGTRIRFYREEAALGI